MIDVCFLHRFVNDHRICCFFDQLKHCITTQKQPAFFKCGRLVQNLFLRICIWTVGIGSCIGNVYVIILRISEKKQTNKTNIKQRIFIGSLASSDFVMGLYVLILASVDAYYGKEYYKFSDEWRVSIGCRIAGFMSLFSAETSLLLLALLTLDRFLVLVFPFSMKHFRKFSTIVAAAGALVIGFAIGFSATILADRDSNFYELSDVCIGLPLVTGAGGYVVQPKGVEDTGVTSHKLTVPIAKDSGKSAIFSIIIFLGLNSGICVLILIEYVVIFVSITRTSRNARRVNIKKEIKMALSMLAVVMPNLLCWIPIVFLGILSQIEYVNLGLDIYVWAVVFILPVNASLNPILYTLAVV